QVYQVERSTDGRNWNTAGSVTSFGSTSAQHSYSFADNNISGLRQYYRLRQVDVNGATKLSNIVIISGIRPTTLVLTGLFPNPAASRVSLLVDAPAKDILIIQVMDAVGRVVKTQKSFVDAGSNTLELNVTGLMAGSYLVKVNCEAGCQTAVSKFVKE
ncbi:MAG TPA: T9SS type A sorting domain-containing protein, partial [Flavisolibacter sp.]|nr:T9SS type A sorting domain-containing protein [Flavisolibacter sp.]